jgi:Kae1-associated kinase Bud32
MIIKKRLPKGYRFKALDSTIREERTRAEARIISESRRWGVPTPIIYDSEDFEITMEYIDEQNVKDILTPNLSRHIGTVVDKLHSAGIIRGGGQCYLSLPGQSE